MTTTAQAISTAVNSIALKGVTVSAVPTTLTVSVLNLPAVTLTSRWIDWLLPVLIGGALSLAGSWWATRQSHRNAIEREESNKRKTYRRFIESIRDELKTVFDLYMARLGKNIDQLPDHTPFILTGKQDEDYFTVFSSNANLLMLVEDDKLRKAIVMTYAKAKTLKDSISLNNAILEKLDEANRLKITGNASARNGIDERIDELGKNLVEYAKSLKQIHNEAKIEVGDLLDMIAEKLISDE